MDRMELRTLRSEPGEASRVIDPRPVAITDAGRLVAVIGVTQTPEFAALLPSVADIERDSEVDALLDTTAWLE